MKLKIHDVIYDDIPFDTAKRVKRHDNTYDLVLYLNHEEQGRYHQIPEDDIEEYKIVKDDENTVVDYSEFEPAIEDIQEQIKQLGEQLLELQQQVEMVS